MVSPASSPPPAASASASAAPRLVEDGSRVAVVASIAAGLEVLATMGFDASDAADVRAAVEAVEEVLRRADAVSVAMVGAVARSDAHRLQGHRSARGLVAHTCRLDGPEGWFRATAAKALARMPVVEASFRAGRIGRCQVRRILATWVNVRVREALEALDAEVTAWAESCSYDDLHAVLAQWERLADADGAEGQARAAHVGRRLRVSATTGTGMVRGEGGALDTAELASILDAFAQAEFDADVAAARLALGPDVEIGANDLPRTPAQRSWDALMAMARAGATVIDPAGRRVEVVVAIDHRSFEEALARVFGTQPPASAPAPTPEPEPETALTLHDAAQRRCATIDGVAVDPVDTVHAALVASVRRAVYDAKGVTIDLGRRSRLFTGPSQLAVRLSTPRCAWPGCPIPTSACQSDHLQPWHRAGPTDIANGAPLCAFHNRHRTNGTTAQRDHHGHLRFQDPDGLEIPDWHPPPPPGTTPPTHHPP